MKRLRIKSIAAANLAAIGLSLGAVCASVAMMQVTAADRLVDGGYDQAITVASSAIGARSSAHRHGASAGLLRLAAHASAVAEPTAATEHVWLTRRALHVEPLAAAAVPALSAMAISSTVGARFTLANAGEALAQTLEVVDVREIAPDHMAADHGPAKLLLVSCKVVADGTSPARTGLVRFIVDADSRAAAAAHPVLVPRAL